YARNLFLRAYVFQEKEAIEKLQKIPYDSKFPISMKDALQMRMLLHTFEIHAEKREKTLEEVLKTKNAGNLFYLAAISELEHARNQNEKAEEHAFQFLKGALANATFLKSETLKLKIAKALLQLSSNKEA